MRVKLSEITNYSKGAQINGDELIENGEYIYLNGGINPSGRWSSSNVSGDTVTISEGGNSSGYVNYISEPFWCGAHCYYLYDGPSNSKYLYYALKSQQDRLFAIRSGACMPNIKKSDLGNFELEFDSDEQKQNEIVKILSNVEQVISSRQKELELFDEFIKARFVELFGDLNTNPKGWDLKTFDELTYLITDGEHATPHRCDKGIYLLSARNVLNHALQLEDVDYIDEDEYERIAKRIVPQAGDVLLSCSGTVGRCCCVPEGLKFQMVRSTAILRFKEELNPVFAEYMITSDYVQNQIDKAKTASSQANLFQGKIAKLKGFVPPIELQDEFLGFVKQVDKSKVIVQKALDETQKLFNSLMQKYFRG